MMKEPTAAEKMGKRIEEIKKLREAERARIIAELPTWESARQNALDTISRLNGNPEKISEYTAARTQVDYTTLQIEELRNKLDNPVKLISITPEESRRLFKQLKSELNERAMKAAAELQSLYSNFIKVQKEIYEAEKKNRTLMTIWKNEIDPDCEAVPIMMFDHRLISEVLNSESLSVFGQCQGDKRLAEIAEAIEYMKLHDYD